MAEVARLAQVSTATVSRVFNEPAKVSDSIQQRVREAAAALHWIPNAAGRALASRRSHIAGAIIPTLDNEIFARQISGMQAVFAENGFTLLLGCSNYDPAEGLNQVQAMLAQGIEVLALVGENYPPQAFDLLRQRGIPYVLTYGFRHDSPHPCIGFDNRAAFRQIADYIVSLGHKRIAAIFQPVDANDRVVARLEGLREGLAAGGVTLRATDLHIGPSSMDFGAESLRRIMASKTRPTAIICGNDNLALGAISAALDLGFDIPNDLSITGFDDLAIVSRIAPQLTTMRVDNLEIGRLAGQQLVQAAGGGVPVQSHELRADLRLRATTSPPRSAAGATAAAGDGNDADDHKPRHQQPRAGIRTQRVEHDLQEDKKQRRAP
ncbi:LacI family DNA-binding transcriptional regulator [Acidisoma cellulosilytica]|uniref:LacI family DNA-binding transcriptional regulator n=1 Tax=Acidisoma cellulosilyticum TaxID=2802395 RepID=A0A963Z1P6_9PROT|nr:LacI family DNA-binding transcriptional regulator [Acidisoma cellulosilyticum]